MAAVDQLGHASFPALKEHVVITVLCDFLGLAFHDPEGHQIYRVLNCITDRQLANADTAIHI